MWSFLSNEGSTRELKKKMLQFQTLTAKPLPTTNSLFSIRLWNPKFSLGVARTIRSRCSFKGDGEHGPVLANFAGLQLEETVDSGSAKLRLDSWISSRISGISRARVQSSIKAGLVHVNGRPVHKVNLQTSMSLERLGFDFDFDFDFCKPDHFIFPAFRGKVAIYIR